MIEILVSIFLKEKRDLFEIQWFVSYWNPWLMRGTYYVHGLDAGVFAFRYDAGRAAVTDSFRV